MPNEEALAPVENENMTAELAGLLDGIQPDQYGLYRLDEVQTGQVEKVLADRKLLFNQPSQEELVGYAGQVKEMIKQDIAREQLSNMPFLDNRKFREILGERRSKIIVLQHPLYLDPTAVAGAASFNSWAGRGLYGRGTKNREGIESTSIDTILDYASRDTPMPVLSVDGGIDIASTTDDRSVIYSSNSHRTAAAKLRNEPLGFSAFRLYV